MNYPEYILRRSETLWKEREETWQRELATAAGVVREKADVENAEEENAVKRLAEKIFSTGSETAAEAMRQLAAQERETRGFAEVSGVGGSAPGEDGSAQWLADELRRGTTEGIAPTWVQERDAGFPQIYEAADLQMLSQSVERDARRYDGGFLLY